MTSSSPTPPLTAEEIPPPLDVEKLKEIASAASQGDWMACGPYAYKSDGGRETYRIEAPGELVAMVMAHHELGEKNAEFLVAAQPATFLRLLSALAEHQETIAGVIRVLSGIGNFEGRSLGEALEDVIDEKDRRIAELERAAKISDDVTRRLQEHAEALARQRDHYYDMAYAECPDEHGFPGETWQSRATAEKARADAAVERERVLRDVIGNLSAKAMLGKQICQDDHPKIAEGFQVIADYADAALSSPAPGSGEADPRLRDLARPDHGFRVGDRVRIASTAPYAADWQGVELTVVGMRLTPSGKMTFHVSENWPADGGFDDVPPEDLVHWSPAAGSEEQEHG